MKSAEEKLYRQAYLLSLFTIAYNILEGLISMILGYKDETLTLFGFGADSFIEVISGFGIAMMIVRIKRNPESPVSKFEIRALKITGFSFYMLAVGLFFGIITNLIYHHKPENTIWGVIIAMTSIVIMIWLLMAKKAIGKKINSEPIIADANCTKICIYMSLTLLASSLIYKLTGFTYIDSIGAIGLIYFSINEGKEAYEKAKTKSYSCCDDC